MHPKTGGNRADGVVKQTSGSLPEKGCALTLSLLLLIVGKAIW